MKNLIIIGASGFGREVAWLVERINNVSPTWNLLGFVDDNESLWDTQVDGYKVLGGSGTVGSFQDCCFVCAIGSSNTRKAIIGKIKQTYPEITFASLVDPSVIISDKTVVGAGSIICAGCIITVDIEIGEHVIINLDCTIGHDAVLSDFVTLYPSVNISGCTKLLECVEMGTGSQLLQGKTVGKSAIVGAGAVVISDISESGTFVGVPAKKMK